MDRIGKALKKLSVKEREFAKEIFKKLSSDNLNGLDIKKLIDREDIFRVRKGNLRIIYRKINNQIFILAIERRNETTYKASK
ncbi:MAG: hypothetical protein ABH822_02155 [Patescibacteria group bacterium]